MPGITRAHVSDARGAGRLLVDASTGVVDVVERMHRTIQRRPGILGRHVLGTTRGITGFVYWSIRGGMHLAGRGLDASLAPLEQLLPTGEATPGRDVFFSVLNGLYGDYLARTGNPLAIPMHVRDGGVALDAANPSDHFAVGGRTVPTGKLLVLVHGLCMSDQQWTREGQGHGTALASELGYTSLYLRYNSGLHVAENGRLFAQLLQRLVTNWPRPVEELTIIGHSMGGLVARSACHVGERLRHHWPARLRKLVFLGTPHHGAPLERGGHGLDYLMGLSPYSAPLTRLAKARSAGIKDLRRGTIAAGGHRLVPLPKGVDCYAMAATLATRRSLLSDRVIGDGLVPLDSALGEHANPDRSLGFPKAHRSIGYQMGHLELLRRPEVYAQLRTWLGGAAS